MLAIIYTALFVAIPSIALLWSHISLHGGFNYLQLTMAVWCIVNVMICLWEWALFFYQDQVQKEFAGFKKNQKTTGQLPSPIILFQEMSLGKAVSLKTWATIWSTYALIDPSYADTTTWGFWVDTGNGLVTIFPSALFAVGITFDILPARLLGLIGFVTHYQEFYGTVIYFAAYIYNKRYAGQPFANKALVAFSNGLWLIFPGIAMWASYVMIDTGNFDLFR